MEELSAADRVFGVEPDIEPPQARSARPPEPEPEPEFEPERAPRAAAEPDAAPKVGGGRRFGLIADRLAGGRGARSQAADVEAPGGPPPRWDEPPDDDWDDRPPVHVEPPFGPVDVSDDRPATEGDAFVIRPRISARQASELADGADRPARFRPLFGSGPSLPPVSPAGP
ncbi:MAG: hypothetical protein AB1673_12275 [Actinomycetota bacterium]